MELLLASFLALATTATAPYSGSFCSVGTDSEGYESPAFTVSPEGYSDANMSCKNIEFEDIGNGWTRVHQACPSGQEQMELKVSGETATVVLEDGHEYPLKRCP